MSVRNIGIVFSPTLGIPAGVFTLLLAEFQAIFWGKAAENHGDNTMDKFSEKEKAKISEESEIVSTEDSINIGKHENKNSQPSQNASENSEIDVEKSSSKDIDVGNSTVATQSTVYKTLDDNQIMPTKPSQPVSSTSEAFSGTFEQFGEQFAAQFGQQLAQQYGTYQSEYGTSTAEGDESNSGDVASMDAGTIKRAANRKRRQNVGMSFYPISNEKTLEDTMMTPKQSLINVDPSSEKLSKRNSQFYLSAAPDNIKQYELSINGIGKISNFSFV